MRTNIVIDDDLIKEALEVGKYKTKKEAVEAGLRLIIGLSRQKSIREFRGKLPWRGSLNQMRKSRFR